MKEGKSRRGGIYWETVIDTEYSGDWGVDMMRRECVRKIRCFLACVPLRGCVRIHHPSCVHPGADRVQSTQRFLLHRRPTARYSFLNPKHLGQFAWKKEPPAKIKGGEKINVQACYPLGLLFFFFFFFFHGISSESRFRLARENPVHRSCLPLQSVRCEQFSKCCT